MSCRNGLGRVSVALLISPGHLQLRRPPGRSWHLPSSRWATAATERSLGSLDAAGSRRPLTEEGVAEASQGQSLHLSR